jgi:DNA-binding transcriptional MerR regulator
MFPRLNPFSMDIDKVIKTTTPWKRKSESRLSPYVDQILTLLSKGYSLTQIRALLKEHDGVSITLAGLSAYMKRHEIRLNKSNQKVEVKNESVKSEKLEPLKISDSSNAVEGKPRKISNPADLKKARNEEINLDDYTE